MLDAEKVKKGLQMEIESRGVWDCKEQCPYTGIQDCATVVCSDALELIHELEERIAIMEENKPESTEIVWQYGFPHCSVCGQMLPEGDSVKYCLHCGRSVKWE